MKHSNLFDETLNPVALEAQLEEGVFVFGMYNIVK